MRAPRIASKCDSPPKQKKKTERLLFLPRIGDVRCTSNGFFPLLQFGTHCDTLQDTATYCTILQHTATHCNTLQHTATLCNTLQRTLQHTATGVGLSSLPTSTLPHTQLLDILHEQLCLLAFHILHTLQLTATRCNTHYNTLNRRRPVITPDPHPTTHPTSRHLSRTTLSTRPSYSALTMDSPPPPPSKHTHTHTLQRTHTPSANPSGHSSGHIIW